MTKLIDTPKCLLVGNLPNGAIKPIIALGKLYYLPNEFALKSIWVDLSPNSYGQPILASEMDENRASGFVDWYEDSNDSSYDPQYNETTYFNVIKNYETDDEDGCDTFLESFASLLRSHNLQPSTTLVIPKTI